MSLQNGGRERPSNAVKMQTAVRIAAPRRSASKILLDKWKRDKNYFSRTTFVIMRCIGCVAALAGVNLQISAITTSCWYFGSAGNATNSEGGLLGHWGHESQVVHEIDKIAGEHSYLNLARVSVNLRESHFSSSSKRCEH